MATIRFGFQTYTWQMSYARFQGRVPHILDVVAKAGGAGFEPEICMLGDYAIAPERLADELSQRQLQLGGLAYVADWRHTRETDDEKVSADRAMEFVLKFPAARFLLCQMPGKDRTRLVERQKNCLACINAVARRAADKGLIASFHPNSPPGSLFRVRSDYDRLLNGVDAAVLGFTPDSGHMAKGGMDPLDMVKTYRPLVRHLHFKDISQDRHWVEMGRGVTDFPAIVSHLAVTDFDGWIMVEDESHRAESDPDAVTLENGQYIRKSLLKVAQQ